jgi:hypothetical protein
MCQQRRMIYIVTAVWVDDNLMMFSWLHSLSVAGFKFRDPKGGCSDSLISRGFLS